MRFGRTGITTTLAVAALLGAPAVASASVSAAVYIHQVTCSSTTFTVYYDSDSRMACYEGTGEIGVAIPHVDLVATGHNSGRFEIEADTTYRFVSFQPNENIVVSPANLAVMVLIDITGS